MPILSICIPTFNRSSYLENTLTSITNQARFIETDDVEIVISDNCSDDNTEEISLRFVEQFGTKVLYFRNEDNIKDANFKMALSRGTGDFLKLNNDTLVHKEGSLNRMIDVISQNIDKKINIFFLNQNRRIEQINICADLNELLLKASYFLSWIGGFGVWKEDFSLITDFDRYKVLQLTQVDVLFRLVSKKACVICNERLFDSVAPASKGAYDVVTVFLDNYIFILKEQVTQGHLTKKAFRLEEKRILLKFFLKSLIKSQSENKNLTLQYADFKSRFMKYYWCRPILLIRFFLLFGFKTLITLYRNRSETKTTHT